VRLRDPVLRPASELQKGTMRCSHARVLFCFCFFARKAALAVAVCVGVELFDTVADLDAKLERLIFLFFFLLSFYSSLFMVENC
jgi:hypothetical protein